MRRRSLSVGLLFVGVLWGGFACRVPAPESSDVVPATVGGDRGRGRIEGAARSAESVRATANQRAMAIAELDALHPHSAQREPDKQILFGDLHVHTTYSSDAFMFSLPILNGEGAHPPSDACDFARHCSSLDFFALTDHAAALTPEHWAAEKQSMRACNAVAGDAADPDVVAFTGFEWTQSGFTAADHFGHRNVIFPETAEESLPTRPISASMLNGPGFFSRRARELGAIGAERDPENAAEYLDLAWLGQRIDAIPACEEGVDTRLLPPECVESAPTADVLMEKLAQWNLGEMVIPHGTAWGIYTPRRATIEKQLEHRYYDPGSMPLIEIMSGHGNSEQYRSWRPVGVGDDGAPFCPAPTTDYLPCCWQAGEIARDRCGDIPEAECDTRVAETRAQATARGPGIFGLFPDASAADWLDCEQCRDCFKPAYSLRPLETVQYAMSLSNFAENGDDGRQLRYRYGFIASSDDHNARPGTGYKQVLRHLMTDTAGARAPEFGDVTLAGTGVMGFERGTSFLYPGGLTAVHTSGRGRREIWQALERREAYGTSGPRILLYFDLIDGERSHPMGSEVELAGTPHFSVRAVGAFEQRPGCPAEPVSALSSERLDRLCGGECFHPGEARHRIEAIEVVRIRPQQTPGESVDALIEDPWKRFECPPDPSGCAWTFEDADFERDSLYYVRALQEPTPAINADGFRSDFDPSGQAVSIDPCWGRFETDPDDDCLAPARERAWSSPIFVDRPRS